MDNFLCYILIGSLRSNGKSNLLSNRDNRRGLCNNIKNYQYIKSYICDTQCRSWAHVISYLYLACRSVECDNLKVFQSEVLFMFFIIACLYYNHIFKIPSYWNIYQRRHKDSMYCFRLLYDPFDTLWRSFFSYKTSSQGYKNLFIILRMEYVSHYCYHFWNRVW